MPKGLRILIAVAQTRARDRCAPDPAKCACSKEARIAGRGANRRRRGSNPRPGPICARSVDTTLFGRGADCRKGCAFSSRWLKPAAGDRYAPVPLIGACSKRRRLSEGLRILVAVAQARARGRTCASSGEMRLFGRGADCRKGCAFSSRWLKPAPGTDMRPIRRNAPVRKRRALPKAARTVVAVAQTHAQDQYAPVTAKRAHPEEARIAESGANPRALSKTTLTHAPKPST